MNNGKKGVFISCDEDTLNEFNRLAPSAREKELFLKGAILAYSHIKPKIEGIKKGIISGLLEKVNVSFFNSKRHGL